MTEGEDWKIQLSKKVNGDLWNIRATSAEEFKELTEGLAKVADEALTNIGSVVQVTLAKGIQTEELADPNPPPRKAAGRKATGSGVPSCKHGPMKDLAEKNYRHRFYCASTNRDDQCEAKD